MKRMTATVLLLSALSAPAFAESPTQRDMHSWDYVQTTAYPPTQSEAPVINHNEQRPYYHHEEHHAHHGKTAHHHGKKVHHHHMAKKHTGKHHHHHHTGTKAETPAKDQPKQ